LTNVKVLISANSNVSILARYCFNPYICIVIIEKQNTEKMTTTKFGNLTIIHPHSGKVSRSVVRRALLDNTFTNNRNLSTKQICERFKAQTYGQTVVKLEDVDYCIRVADTFYESEFDEKFHA